MQYSISAIAIVALAQLVAAQIPECASEIINKYTAAQGCDVLPSGEYNACACLDSNRNAIQAAATTEVIAACGATVALTEVLPAAAAACAQAPESSSEAPETSSTAAPASTTAASSTTAEASTTAEESSTAVETSTTVVETSSTIVAPTTTAAPTVSTSTTVASTGLPTSTTPPYTGGAGAIVPGSVFALGMAVLAAI